MTADKQHHPDAVLLTREEWLDLRATYERYEALLVEAAATLKAVYIAGLTVQKSLDKPYPDDPRWTPWTRWMGQPCRDAHDLRAKIKKALPVGLVKNEMQRSRPLRPPVGNQESDES